jgi:hypothetical protein
MRQGRVHPRFRRWAMMKPWPISLFATRESREDPIVSSTARPTRVDGCPCGGWRHRRHGVRPHSRPATRRGPRRHRITESGDNQISSSTRSIGCLGRAIGRHLDGCMRDRSQLTCRLGRGSSQRRVHGYCSGYSGQGNYRSRPAGAGLGATRHRHHSWPGSNRPLVSRRSRGAASRCLRLSDAFWLLNLVPHGDMATSRPRSRHGKLCVEPRSPSVAGEIAHGA